MTNEDILSKIVKKFSAFEYVDAIVLSGSQTSLIKDEASDFDIYVYGDKIVLLGARKKLAMEHAKHYELGNSFFEYGDEILPKESKVGIDIMYRNISFIQNEIEYVWKKCFAKTGYTTAVLYNVKNSKVLYEKKSIFTNTQKRLASLYPKKLKENIIKKNYLLLKNNMSSYYEQIAKAIKRNDIVSINHRLSAIFASYFDVLFAINERLHPGEKKLIGYALEICKILPNDFEKNIKNIFLNSCNKNLLKYLDILFDELDKIMPSKK